ncbi:MAG TPA: adenylyl-sulfate kinase [Burkholderiales bacterium]
MAYGDQQVVRKNGRDGVSEAHTRRGRQHAGRSKDISNARIFRFLTCGSVDDGKSSLIGRLLKDLSLVPEDTWESVLRESERRNFSRSNPDYSLLLDGLLIEREQGITVDIAWRYFATPNRKFIVADCPGHEHYTRNMVTGASHCDGALVLIDARKGVLAQTRRHLSVVAMMRVGSVLIAVNKMDLVDWDRVRFDAIRREALEYAHKLGLSDVTVIPASATHGGNVVRKAAETPWYAGLTISEALEAMPNRRPPSCSARLVAQWVNRPNQDFRGIAGEVLGAPLRVGDTVRALPSGIYARIDRLCTFAGDLQIARPGQPVTVVLDKELDVARGDWLVKATDVPPAVTDHIEANVVWMSDTPLVPGRRYDFQAGCTIVPGSVRRIIHKLDVETLGSQEASRLACNDVGTCEIVLERSVPVDAYADSVQTGSLIFIDRTTFRTEGAAMVSTVAAKNISWHETAVTRSARASIKGHSPQVIWLTGLSGAGKSTIANALEARLNAAGVHTMLLDGDNVRHGLNRDLGFSEADRTENIRRVGETAKLLLDAGLVVITAFISPFRRERDLVRELVADGEFLEIFVDTPLAVCEQRDPKGLYQRARRGQLPEFTGISQAYEPPSSPDVRIDTSTSTVAQSVESILVSLKARGIHV